MVTSVSQGRQSCGASCTRMAGTASLLEAEQVAMKDDRHVDLKNADGITEKEDGEPRNVSHNALGIVMLAAKDDALAGLWMKGRNISRIP